jgi:two-component system, response regulator PdtaR
VRLVSEGDGVVVLIVEDNTLLAYMIEDALTERGHAVLGPAGKPAAAVRLVEQTRPALALIDIDLEDDRTGVELARELRDRWGVPTLFATGQVATAKANFDLALGVIAKPFSPAAIVRSVEVAGRILRGDRDVDLPPELELFGRPAG